jgi:hypothetical protein
MLKSPPNANRHLTIHNSAAGTGHEKAIDGQMIKTTYQMRLLGVDIDEKMNFSVHISEMCKKVSRKVGVLMRLRNMIPESAKLTIYKSSILPYLTYCQLVWHFCKSSDSKIVERICYVFNRR